MIRKPHLANFRFWILDFRFRESKIQNPKSKIPLQAFSLVEIVIAIAVLSVGLVGALRVFPVGLRASQRSEVSSRSAIIAQRTLESLKLKPWTALTDGETAADVEGLHVTTRIRSVTIPPLTDPARVKALEVAVQSIQDGRPRTLTFITYVRRPPT